LPKAIIVSGALIVFGLLLGLAVVDIDSSEPVRITMSSIIPGLGVFMLMMGVVIYVPARRRLNDRMVTMAGGDRITPEALEAGASEGGKGESPLLEENARKWGFEVWDPQLGSYEAWEWTVLRRYIGSRKARTKLDINKMYKSGFRPVVVMEYQREKMLSKGRPFKGPKYDYSTSDVVIVIGIMMILGGISLFKTDLVIGGVAMFMIGALTLGAGVLVHFMVEVVFRRG